MTTDTTDSEKVGLCLGTLGLIVSEFHEIKVKCLCLHGGISILQHPVDPGNESCSRNQYQL